MVWQRNHTLVTFSAVVVLCGCADPQAASRESSAPRWIKVHPDLLEENVFANRRAGEEPSTAAGPAQAFALETHFYVWRFQTPVDRISGSEQLWDHLDESAVAHSESVLLKRNGIRVGVGKAALWPAVRAILMMHEPQVWRSPPVVSDGGALSLELGELPADVSVFYYDSRDQLMGAWYSGGRMSFRVNPRIDLDDVGRLSIQFLPQISRRSPLTTKGFELQTASPGDAGSASFDELAFAVTLERGHFIIIGPSRASSMPHLLGGRFLRSTENGKDYENIYCVVPRIYQRRMPPNTHIEHGSEELER